MNWLVRLCSSLSTVRATIAEAANVVYVDRTAVAEGMLVAENISKYVGKKKKSLLEGIFGL